MIIEINTTAKTITLKDRVTLGELFDWLNKHFPDFAWESWVITEHIEYYTNPYQAQPWTTGQPLQPYSPQPNPFSTPNSWPGSTITFLGRGNISSNGNTYLVDDVRHLTIDKLSTK